MSPPATSMHSVGLPPGSSQKVSMPLTKPCAPWGNSVGRFFAHSGARHLCRSRRAMTETSKDKLDAEQGTWAITFWLFVCVAVKLRASRVNRWIGSPPLEQRSDKREAKYDTCCLVIGGRTTRQSSSPTRSSRSRPCPTRRSPPRRRAPSARSPAPSSPRGRPAPSVQVPSGSGSGARRTGALHR